MFSKFDINDEINNNELNSILKNLYNTNYFKDINVLFKNNILTIYVEEYPIIQSINYTGIKSNKIIEQISIDK